MKIARRVLLGCLAVLILGVLVLVVVAGVMVALGPPEQRPARAEEEQPVTVPRLPPGVTPSPREVPPPAAALRVELSLDEGRFDVAPGEPGGGVRVEADYDQGLYELAQETVPTSGGGQTVRIDFRPRYSTLRRLLTLGHVDANRNRVRVVLPPDVPLTLAGSIERGESRIDLSGLALSGLDLDLAMGRHEVSIDKPNPLTIADLRLSMRMGELRARGLGNARFRAARLEGSMGNMDIDLRGAYAADARVDAHLSMGEMRLRIPDDVRVKVESRILLGESGGKHRDAASLPPDAPTLVVTGSVTLGGIRLE
jgi:hypothetical protein